MPRQDILMIFPACVLVAVTIGCAERRDAGIPVNPRRTSHVEQVPATAPSMSLESDQATVTPAIVAGETSAVPPDEPPIELAQANTAGGRIADISFDDLKLDIQPASRFDESMLTEQIKNLDGQPIRIRGVMYPTFSKKGNKQFILLMNKECKFGSTKDPVWCNIRVVMDEGEGADYTYDPVTVEGVLSLDVMNGPKYDLSVYMLTGATLK